MISADQDLTVDFSGSLITGQKLFKELAIILVVALLLLYFILAAQFESLTQPFIVLLEIPIDIAGALASGEALGRYDQHHDNDRTDSDVGGNYQ